LYLDGAPITDLGLRHLKGLAKLRHLSLCGTRVSDGGLALLQRALPQCVIDH
jgi:hypothetical protein